MPHPRGPQKRPPKSRAWCSASMESAAAAAATAAAAAAKRNSDGSRAFAAGPRAAAAAAMAARGREDWVQDWPLRPLCLGSAFRQPGLRSAFASKQPPRRPLLRVCRRCRRRKSSRRGFKSSAPANGRARAARSPFQPPRSFTRTLAAACASSKSILSVIRRTSRMTEKKEREQRKKYKSASERKKERNNLEKLNSTFPKSRR